MTVSKAQSLKDMTFEQAMSELEQIVRQLEEGKMPLEQAIVAFSRGSQLKQYCEEMLKSAKLKVDQIMINTEGQVTLTPFSEDKKA